MPTMGPFRFLRYTGKNRVTVELENIMTHKRLRASATHLLPFDAEVEPAMLR
jgi:hypothetical protein